MKKEICVKLSGRMPYRRAVPESAGQKKSRE